MIKNYFKIAWRNIARHKGYSLINIAGLAIGIAVCLLILMFVRYELSYDNYHLSSDQLYRIERQFLSADGSVRGHFCSLAPSFTVFLEKEFPEIDYIARMVDAGNVLVSYVDVHFAEDRFFFAENDVFKIFTTFFVRGDQETALSSPNSLVISESTAAKYFGDEDPIGKQVKVNRDNLYQITGVIRDVPDNSHFHYDFLASYLTLKGTYVRAGDDYFYGTRNFSDNVAYTYMKLAENAEIDDIAAQIPAFIDRHLGIREDQDGNIIRASQGTTIHFSKVKDIHLYSRTSNELEANGDIRYVMLFTIIAVFVLVIGCINFMNLSTARAAKRAREVGLRKVVGAHRHLLTSQFLGEALVITLLALVMALVVVGSLLPYFGTFSGRPLSFGLLFNLEGFLILAAVFLVTGLASGFYPAIYLSAFKPVTILRGELTRGSSGVRMRRILVVFQFAVSIALIICVSVVFRQMRFLQNADVGFQKENIVMFPADRVIKTNWMDFKQQLESSPQILHATLSKRAPTGRLYDAPGFRVEISGEMITSPFTMPHNRVEHDFFRTYGIQVIAGRDFSFEHSTDGSEAFIINETAVRRLGLPSPEDAVGLPTSTFAPDRNGRVIGVVADFNYESMHHQILPIISYVRIVEANTVSFRVASGGIRDALDHAKQVWARFNPEFPFQYEFLDDRIAALYRNETRIMHMFGYFSLLAILVACLGLFGLASFTAEQRTKEIGIRKVLGATVSNIVMLLSQDFTKWVLVANLVAWPVAYFAMSQWLGNFAYRISISTGEFVFAGTVTLAISLFTVSFQSVKSASAHPAESLRYE